MLVRIVLTLILSVYIILYTCQNLLTRIQPALNFQVKIYKLIQKLMYGAVFELLGLKITIYLNVYTHTHT